MLLPPWLNHGFPGRYAPIVVVSTEYSGGLPSVLHDKAVLCTELVQSEVQERYVVVGAVVDQTHAQRFKANLIICKFVKSERI